MKLRQFIIGLVEYTQAFPDTLDTELSIQFEGNILRFNDAFMFVNDENELTHTRLLLADLPDDLGRKAEEIPYEVEIGFKINYHVFSHLLPEDLFETLIKD